MRKRSVLFVCIHNSARSQMAEALLTSFCSEAFEVESAGIEAGTLNPLAVEAMAEVGIDISRKSTQQVADLIDDGRTYDFVITVCDEASAERCPVFPGEGTRLHWSFPDPSAFEGSWENRLARTREVRDAITARVRDWCSEVCGPSTTVRS